MRSRSRLAANLVLYLEFNYKLASDYDVIIDFRTNLTS